MKNKILISLFVSVFSLSPVLALANAVEENEISQNYNQTKNRANNIANQVAEFLSDKNLSLEERVEIITNPDFGQVEETANQEIDDNQDLNNNSPEQNQVGQVIAPEKSQNRSRIGQALISVDRRSEVASAVQTILDNTENRQDIGQKVREIAKNHAKNHENLITPLARLKSQHQFIRFIFGPEPQALAQAQQILQDNQVYLEELKNLKNSLDSENEKIAIDQALNKITEIESELQEIVENSTRGFSIFGWLIKLVSSQQK